MVVGDLIFEFAMRNRNGRGIETGKLRETDVRQASADGNIQALPAAPDAAGFLDAAVTVTDRAIRQRKRSFQGIEDRRGADVARRARQLIAAVQATARGHERRTLQLLQKFARGRLTDM